jgi:predicted naringenin-chalcone synthase
MSIITSIGTAVPEHKHQQSDIQKFMVALSNGSEKDKRIMSLMYARSGIQTRYSVVPDYSCDVSEREFYPKTSDLEPFPNVDARMKTFNKHATTLAVAAVNDAFEGQVIPNDITHLITVSCTGLAAPGLDIEMVKALKLSSEIIRTSVNFMGCYAAIHALKHADAFCKTDPNAKILIVLVELCTLHFQKGEKMDYITSNLLFGDGAAACLVQNKGAGFSIESFYSKLYLEAEESMAWHVSSSGFLMSLKSEVPKLIEDNMLAFVKNALLKVNLSPKEVVNWAIHPGGKSILEATTKALSLKTEDLENSYAILKEYGNMSSCTLIFILKNLKLQKDETSFAAGFGPGITMESMVLKTV